MRGHARLVSLLEIYDAALTELMSLDDPRVGDLIVRLELWRTAAQLELAFADERENALAAA